MLSIDPGESILHLICVSAFGIDWSAWTNIPLLLFPVARNLL